MIDVDGLAASLNVDTSGLDAKLAAARLGMQQLEAEIRRVEADLNRMPQGANLQPLQDRVADLTRKHQDLAAAMANAYGKLGSARSMDIAAHMERGVDSAARYSRGLMQLGYVVDDLQYGFKSIVNNIGPMALAFGASPGLAGAIQVAAVSAYQFTTQWDTLREALGDTSKMDAAKLSVEGMAAAVKRLKEEAASTSWGDSFAWLLGYDSDAGKASKSAAMEQGLKARNEAEANAKTIESHKTEEQQKDAQRWKDAVAESGGMGALLSKVYDQVVKEGGGDLGRFLSTERGWGGGGSSQRDEYMALKAKPAQERTDAERTRLATLETMAQDAAMKSARQRVGAALYDPEAQKAIGDLVGGDAGDLLAGRTMTQREAKEAEKEGVKVTKGMTRAQAAELARERKWAKDNAEFAETVSPGVAKSAELEVAKAKVAGKSTAGLVEHYTARLTRAGMSEADAAEAAKGFVQAGEKAYNKDPNAARKKLEKEERERAKDWEEANAQLAEMVSPGTAKAAEQAVVRAKVAGKSIDEAMKEITQRLTDPNGPNLTEADARAAATRFVRAGLEKYNRDPKGAAERLEREEESDRRERIRAAEKALPGIKDVAEHNVMRALLGGRSMDEVRNELRSAMVRGGKDPQEATRTSEELTDEAVRSVREKATGKYLDALEGLDEARRNDLLNARSEVYSASELTHKIQGSIGATSEAQKQTAELVKANALLEKIAGKETFELIVS